MLGFRRSVRVAQASTKAQPSEQSTPSAPSLPNIEPIWHELATKRFWILTILGLFCLMASTIAEQDLALSTIGRSDPKILSGMNAVWYENPQVWAGLIREIGFAAFIALVIGVLVERSARIEQQQAAANMLNIIARNVLEATFSTRSPEAIVRHTISTILNVPIVRPSVRLSFAISALPKEQGQFAEQFVLCAVSIIYELQNVGGVPVDHPIRLLIPVPAEPALKDLAGVYSGSIGDEPLNADRIAEGGKAITNTGYETRYEWKRRIRSNEGLRVVLNYQLVKEISDTETWSSLVPSNSLEVVVDMQKAGLEWNVDALHSGNLRAVDAPDEGPRAPGRVMFRTREPILPFQGIHLWWRPARPAPRGKEDAQPIG